MLFGILAHGDIADGGGDQDSLGAFKRAEHDLDGETASILPPPDQLNSGANMLGQGFGRSAGSIGDEPLRKALGNDVGYFLAYQLVAAIAKLLFGLGIQQDDLSTLVHHHHAIGSGFHESAVPRLRLLVFAEVAAYLRESAQIPRRIPQGDEGDAGQKLRTDPCARACRILRAGRCAPQSEGLLPACPV